MTDAAHPLLPSGTPLLRGTDDAVQVGGVDSADGILLTQGGGWLRGFLRGLDGRRAQRAVLDDAAGAGQDPATVVAVLDALRAAGLIVDLDAADLLATDAGPAAAARAASELPAAVGPGAGGRRSGWRARRTTAVVVEGATRVGVPLAALLAASGVGRVSVRDPAVTGAGDAVVGGLTAADEGRPRSVAAADAIRRASPLTDLRPLPAGTAPDLVVLSRAWAASDPLVADLHRAGVPHLVATVRGQTGVVGPLVVPGATSCLRCCDLHRADADPRWPVLAAQLTAEEPPPDGATLTCLLTAATAALQALAYLEGSAAPVALQATLELRPPDLVPRLRPWPPHPDCGCLIAPDAGTAPERAAAGAARQPDPRPVSPARGRRVPHRPTTAGGVGGQ